MEKETLDTFMKDVVENEEDRKKEMASVQKKYLDYEADFFAQVNQAKKHSRVSGV